jgi:hypothetical protein
MKLEYYGHHTRIAVQPENNFNELGLERINQ